MVVVMWRESVYSRTCDGKFLREVSVGVMRWESVEA